MTKIEKSGFGFVGNEEVYLYTIANSQTSAQITNYGATWVSFCAPDATGEKADVLLGYDNIESYMNNGGYLGAVIGRHSNRIADASFELNGTMYKLGANDGTNNLHGGPKGFDTKIWDVEIIKDGDNEKLKLSTFSEHLDQGYPGNLEVSIVYSLSDDNEFKLEYYAKSDMDTVVNLTNHAYFNLKGHDCGSIDDHSMKFNADFYTPLSDENVCPTGEIKKVEGTPFDFKDFHIIGERNTDTGEYFGKTGGYDHNFVLKTTEKQMTLAVEVLEPKSGRMMTVYTDKPGIQLYTGNMIPDVVGKNNTPYTKRSGFCLETQYFPNAMVIPFFPSPILKAGEVYNYTTIYKFTCKK